MKNSNSRRYLISAILWTVVALAAFVLLMYASSGQPIGVLSGLVLIAMCIVGQWLRYFKSR